jgi:hypothetical protein
MMTISRISKSNEMPPMYINSFSPSILVVRLCVKQFLGTGLACV